MACRAVEMVCRDTARCDTFGARARAAAPARDRFGARIAVAAAVRHGIRLAGAVIEVITRFA